MLVGSDELEGLSPDHSSIPVASLPADASPSPSPTHRSAHSEAPLLPPRTSASLHSDYGSTLDDNAKEGERLAECQETKEDLAEDKIPLWYCCFENQKHAILFWVALVALLVLFATGMGFLIVKIVIPHLAQQALNRSSLQFNAVRITNPTENSIEMNVRAQMVDFKKMKGFLLPAKLTVDFDGSSIGQIDFPKLDLEAIGSSVFDLNTVLAIQNMDAFIQFFRASLNSEFVSLIIHGPISVKTKVLGSITDLNLHLSKVISIKGFDGLMGAFVSQFEIQLSTPVELHAFVGISVTNPSIVSISPIGNVVLDIFCNGTRIGYGESNQESILMGENFIGSNGTLIYNEGTPEAQLIDDLISNYEVLGRTSILSVSFGPNSTEIPLYNAALNGFAIEAALPPLENP